MRERTLFADKNGKELFLGDVVRHTPEKSFNPEVHGSWVEYEIIKGAGGYVLGYVRSEKGVKLPFGYTGTFMFLFECEDVDLKSSIFAEEPVNHPALEWVDDQTTPTQRREAFIEQARERDRQRQNHHEFMGGDATGPDDTP